MNLYTISVRIYVVVMFYSENPFVKALTANQTAFLGEDVTLLFLAAEDSVGTGNSDASMVQIYHNTTNTMVLPLGEAVPNCPGEQSECFEYRYQLTNVKPDDSGIYIARVVGKFTISFLPCTIYT